MKPFPLLLLLAAAAPVLPVTATEKWKIDPKLEPALLDSKVTDDPEPAARFSVSANRKFYSGSFDGVAAGELKGTLMRHSADNPENLSAEAEGIARWLFAQDPGPPPPPGTSAPPPSHTAFPDVFLQLHGTLRFEADQAFDNTQLAIGPRVSLVSLQNTGWRWIVPSVYIGYHRIEVFESEQLRQLGAPERSFYRFDAYGSWKWKPFAAQSTPLKNVGLHADLRYYRAFKMPTAAERASLDDAFYRAFDLSYDLTPHGKKYLREIYVRFARGRLPAATSAARTLSLGIVIAP